MKSRIHGMLLSLFFALAFCLSFGIEASAHDYERSDKKHIYTHPDVEGTTAEEVEMADAEMMKKFLRHVAEHIELIVDDPDLDEDKQEKSRELAIFSKALREEGVFNNGETYIIGITERGAMIDHGLSDYYKDSYGKRYFDDDNPDKNPIIKALLMAGNDSIKCENYSSDDGKERVACAINQDRPVLATPVSTTITTIAGYHHKKDALIDPNCDVLTSEIEVPAKWVEEEKDLDKKRYLLKRYVKGFIAAVSEMQTADAYEVQREILASGGTFAGGLAKAAIRGYEKVTCFREPEFFHDSVYPFIMEPEKGYSFINALDFNLHGRSVSLKDPNPIDGEENVLVAFQKAVTDGSGDLADLAHGNSGFVTYHWDNPTVEGDEVEGYLEKGEVPGNSIKQSYIEVVDLASGRTGAPPNYFVFGSGIYLDEEDEDDGDGGCAITATGSTHQGALLNLVLTASVLFSVVFLRRRA